jgi:predicted site-specific integrase-resolvase
LWDRTGKLKAKRQTGGHRYYTDDDLLAALNIERKLDETVSILYARVSSPKQKGDLDRQFNALENFALACGITIGRKIKQVGGGLNYTRPKFLEVMKLPSAKTGKGWQLGISPALITQ